MFCLQQPLSPANPRDRGAGPTSLAQPMAPGPTAHPFDHVPWAGSWGAGESVLPSGVLQNRPSLHPQSEHLQAAQAWPLRSPQPTRPPSCHSQLSPSYFSILLSSTHGQQTAGCALLSPLKPEPSNGTLPSGPPTLPTEGDPYQELAARPHGVSRCCPAFGTDPTGIIEYLLYTHQTLKYNIACFLIRKQRALKDGRTHPR